MAPLSVEQRQQLEFERAAILAQRRRDNRWSMLTGFVGVVINGIGWASLSESPSSGRLLLILGTALLCVAAGFYARYCGAHFAWGLVAIVFVLLIALIPDRKQQRLDEIAVALTGDAMGRGGSKLPLYFRPSMITFLLFPLAPIGLFLACVGLKDSWQKSKPLNYSIVAVFLNLVSLGLLGNLVMDMFSGSTLTQAVGKSGASIIATGSIQVTVPPGWTENREIATQHQGVLAVSDITNDLHVSVVRETKQDFAVKNLNGYVDLVRQRIRDSVIQLHQMSVPVPVRIAGTQGVSFRSRVTVEGQIVLVSTSTAFETRRYYYRVTGWAIASRAEQFADSIERVTNSLVVPLDD
ncbi:MAG: hypothetical protein JNM18_23455 [Planctomycetaceae bacterium]|nr:hypothetical protein [Planctomycetaceae bacterium]